MTQGITVTYDDTDDDELPLGTVRLDDGEGGGAPFTYKQNEYDPNLVEVFEGHPDGLAALKEIAEKVFDDFTADFEATSEYRARMAKIWKMFIGDLPAKEYPFQHCANMHMPLLLENISRVGARAFDELFGDWTNVFGVAPVGPAGADVAEVLTLHEGWQIRTGIPDFKRQMARGMEAFFLIGDVTCHSYYDEVRGQNCHQILTPDEFITPFMHASASPDYHDLPHYTKILRYQRHELQRMRGKWEHVDEVIDREAPSWGDDPESIMERATAETRGLDPDSSSSAPYQLLWYEGWLELPDQDRDRFCQVILDHETKSIMKLCILEEPDWRDAQRHDRQKAQLADYQQKMQEHQKITQQHQQGGDMVHDAATELAQRGELAPMQAQLIDQHLGEQTDLPPAPTPPPWMQDPSNPDEVPESPKMSPILLFSHAVCIESLVGNLGIGFGDIIIHLNRAANTTLSQFIDAGTQANTSSFLTAQTFEFKKPPVIAPGAFISVPGATSQNLKDGILPLQFQPPSQALMDVVKLCEELSSSAVQSPNALSGEPGKSGETYRGLNERIEQATKQLSVPTRRYGDFFVQIMKNNAKLNALFLPDGEIEAIVAQQTTLPQGKGDPLIEVAKQGRGLYRQGYQVEIRSDLRFTSQAQRIQEADAVVGFCAPNGPLAGNLPLKQYALMKSFEARNRRDLIPFLGPMLGPPSTPLGLPPPPPPGMVPPSGAEGEKPGGAPAGADKAGPQAPNKPPPQPPTPGQPGIA